VSARTKARKRAVDALFAADLRTEHPAALLDETFKQVEDRQNQGPIFDYARTLVDGVVDHQAEIDTLLETYSEGWTLERMPNVDRSILRIAVWEIVYNPELPDGVAIDEAVDLAKEYSTEASGAFVNGLLTRISATKRAL
jgi:transcription antitermination protein NusB